MPITEKENISEENTESVEVNQKEDANNYENELIQEEYKVWKKNSPFLYDLVMTYSLDWPSLTVQWLPLQEKVKSTVTSSSTTPHRILLGTQCDGADQNYLMIADVLLPDENVPIDARKFDDERGEVGGFGGTLAKINIKIRINHDGDVHRARYMPQNPFIIATKSPHPEVLVFDYTKHSSTPTDNICRPQHRCLGHTADGYGISWNPHLAGHLLSASSDGSICHWDINGTAVDVPALHIYRGHNDKAVEDVDWSKFHSTVFGSVGDDQQLLIWDTRNKDNVSTNGILSKVEKAHNSDVNCISFSPFDEFLLGTGGSDGIVKLWDLRNLSHSLHDLHGHKAGVYQLNWSPFSETTLASSSEDRRVYVWDTARIGQEQSPEDAEDGPPELLFIHGGHTSKVFDFSWNHNENWDWYMASVAEDNMLQVWRMASTIYDDEEEEDEADDINDDDLEGVEENAKKKQRI